MNVALYERDSAAVWVSVCGMLSLAKLMKHPRVQRA